MKALVFWLSFCWRLDCTLILRLIESNVNTSYWGQLSRIITCPIIPFVFLIHLWTPTIPPSFRYLLLHGEKNTRRLHSNSMPLDYFGRETLVVSWLMHHCLFLKINPLDMSVACWKIHCHGGPSTLYHGHTLNWNSSLRLGERWSSQPLTMSDWNL